MGRMLLWTLFYIGFTVTAAVYMTAATDPLLQQIAELVFIVFGVLTLIGVIVIGYALIEQAAILWLEMKDRRSRAS